MQAMSIAMNGRRVTVVEPLCADELEAFIAHQMESNALNDTLRLERDGLAITLERAGGDRE
jgi:hypothetical protein